MTEPTAQQATAPFSMYCLHCGGEIQQQPAHMAVSSGLMNNCPHCETNKGRTSVSPEEFGQELRRLGEKYLERAGVKFLQMELVTKR